MSVSERRALVASDSRVARDPRVLKQVTWLVASGYVVDTLGRGDKPAEVNGTHFVINSRPSAVRIAANIFLPKKARYGVLVESAIPSALRRGGSIAAYDLAVINEIELLPWFVGVRDELVKVPSGGRAHLDLHEYSFSQRRGLLHSLLFRRYRHWQAGFVQSTVFSSRSTVSPGIANLWSSRLAIATPTVIRNAPDFVDLVPGAVDPRDIKLVYHGSAAPMRRVDLLISAMSQIDKRFSLHLMLMGSPSWIQALRQHAEPLADRISFHEPVDVRRVANALNAFDLEVIFAPPATDNIRHGLPNKLFESIQGRLGVVTGSAPDKAELVESCRNGVVVQGWSSSDLAHAINALSAGDVERMKHASHEVAFDLSSQAEEASFRNVIGES